MILHNIEPIYDDKSKILILGSFPSVKSREGQFFYDHPQNRFWRLLSELLEQSLPLTHSQKKEFLLNNHIALWDVIASCEIIGSADTTIKNVAPNDIAFILDAAPIEMIFCNGAAAYQNYQKYIFPSVQRQAVKLPSTSPANAAFHIEKLKTEWQIINNYI